MTRYDEVLAAARATLAGMIRRKNPAGIAGMRSVISALEKAGEDEVDEVLDAEIAMRTHEAQTLTEANRDLEASMASYQATLITRLREGHPRPPGHPAARQDSRQPT
ncbi:MAG: hypothetical protein FWD55_05060 [Propionibacteriaceae bacterium]|nr:hypothetical protein [Propionibacteriaceae bacterium]